MSIEKDIAETIVKGVAAKTVSSYLLPDNVAEEVFEDIGISRTQYLAIRDRILETRIKTFLAAVR